MASRPPGDGPPPPPRHAAPTGRAGQGDSVGAPHPHTRADSTWVADPNSPPNGRAVGGGTAPDLRRPSQWWKAPPLGTPFRHPHSEQRRPARAHAVGPVLGPQVRTDRTRDTRVAEPWLPAPEDGRPGEEQRLTPGAPRNGRRPPPRGRPPNPAACSPRRTCRPRGQCWTPTPTPPRPQHVGGGPQQPAQWTGSRGGDGAWPQTPPTMVEGTPPGDALPPPPQRATPARKGARCGAGAGSPRPQRPHPGHTGRGTLATRSRGQAAGGGTAPDTRRPSQRSQATPPGHRPPTPRHAAPAGHAGRGDSVGPPHPHTRAHSMRVADPNSPPNGRAVGGGTAPDLRHPSQWWKATPPATPFRHPHSEQRRPARGHAVGPVLGPHARTDRTRDTRVAEPRLPAPEDGRPGEGQHLTPGAPHNDGRPAPPPPRHAAPAGHAGQGDSVGLPHPHTSAHSTWVVDPNSAPQWAGSRGRDSAWPQTPLTIMEGTPPGTPLRRPHSEQRRPAGAHAVGPVLGPHARTDRTRDTGSRNPGCPIQRAGGRGRGSA